MVLLSNNDIQDFWEDIELDRLLENIDSDKSRPLFFLLNGPPYASGANTHIGTDMNQIFKDIMARFYRMSGFRVYARAGFDSRGLPIEHKVEVQLRNESHLKDASKQELIEAVGGTEAFGEYCKAYSKQNITAMQSTFKKLLIHDIRDPYITFEPRYAEIVWEFIKKAYDAGLIYFSDKPVAWCPSCETGLATGEMKKSEGKIQNLILKIPTENEPGLHSLVWTTTPWSIPFNVALGINPSATYSIINANGEKYLVSQTSELFNDLDGKIVRNISADELMKWTYSPMFPEINSKVKIVSDELVDPNIGSGIVHISPNFASIDDIIGRKNDLSRIGEINERGIITKGPLSGLNTVEADKLSMEIFAEKGLVHRYSMEKGEVNTCWRCDSPLITRASPQVYLKVTDKRVRERLRKMADKIEILPAYRGAQFKNWIDGAVDWCISRSRTWNTPLPIWQSEEGDMMVFKSSDELAKMSGKHMPKEIHTYTLDNIKFINPTSGNLMYRISFGGDVWLDAAVAAIAAGKLFLNEKMYYVPTADLVIEGKDQINNWFYVLSVVSAVSQAADNVSEIHLPFIKMRSHGFVVDSKGKKMSKSLENGVSTQEVMEKGYSIDVLRLATAMNLGKSTFEDIRFNWDLFESMNRELHFLVNSLKFVDTYIAIDGFEYTPIRRKKDWLDEWIVGKKNQLFMEYKAAMKEGLIEKAYNNVINFIKEDLSRTYIRLKRPVAWANVNDTFREKQSFYSTCGEIFLDIAKMIAPACPILSEKIYQNLIDRGINEALDSVHLTSFITSKVNIRHNLEIALMKDMSTKVAYLRESLHFPKRRPFEFIDVRLEDTSLETKLSEYLAMELNSLSINFPKGSIADRSRYPAGSQVINGDVNGVKYELMINTAETEEVERVWATAEISRNIQAYRSKNSMDEMEWMPKLIIVGENLSLNQDALMRTCRINEIIQIKKSCTYNLQQIATGSFHGKSYFIYLE